MRSLFGRKKDKQANDKAVGSNDTTQVRLSLPKSEWYRDLPLVPVGPGHARLHVAIGLDRGNVRPSNQDCLFAYEGSLNPPDADPVPLGLFIVADGMGGHQHGELASRLATGVVAERALGVLLPSLEHPNGQEQDARPLNEQLADLVREANRVVSQAAHEQGSDMGTTLTAALLLGRGVHIAHVGDSRLYCWDGQTLRRVTSDHSLVGRLVEMGQLRPDEVNSHPQRNLLYRSLGQIEDVAVDTGFCQVPNGARLLLCSDGLWGSVPEEELTAMVAHIPSPAETAATLVDRAKQLGGEDNISVIVAFLD